MKSNVEWTQSKIRNLIHTFEGIQFLREVVDLGMARMGINSMTTVKPLPHYPIKTIVLKFPALLRLGVRRLVTAFINSYTFEN